MKRKLLYVSGTRADYGLMSSILNEIKKDKNFDLTILVTGIHLMKEFGYTVDQIKNDGHKIVLVEEIFESDDKNSMATFLGRFIASASPIVNKLDLDAILLLGDRVETLGGALLGNYLSVPTVHFHGGEKTSTVDDAVRHAITQLATYHFPATKQSAKRILNMGQEEFRVKVVGAPSLDTILSGNFLTKKELFEKLNLKDEKTLIVGQHPVTLEVEEATYQMEQTLNAVTSKKMQTVITYPHADAGGRRIIEVIDRYAKLNSNFHVFKSLNYREYLSLMKYAEVLIGNSSGGLIEAPSFKLPYVLVGTRQGERERGNNVIEVDYSQHQISDAIDIALTKEFKNNISENPYGDGKTAKRTVKLLKEIDLSSKVLDKKLTY